MLYAHLPMQKPGSSDIGRASSVRVCVDPFHIRSSFPEALTDVVRVSHASVVVLFCNLSSLPEKLACSPVPSPSRRESRRALTNIYTYCSHNPFPFTLLHSFSFFPLCLFFFFLRSQLHSFTMVAVDVILVFVGVVGPAAANLVRLDPRQSGASTTSPPWYPSRTLKNFLLLSYQ